MCKLYHLIMWYQHICKPKRNVGLVHNVYTLVHPTYVVSHFVWNLKIRLQNQSNKGCIFYSFFRIYSVQDSYYRITLQTKQRSHQYHQSFEAYAIAQVRAFFDS